MKARLIGFALVAAVLAGLFVGTGGLDEHAPTQVQLPQSSPAQSDNSFKDLKIN